MGGQPFASPLVRAVVPQSLGGFGDQRVTPEFHSGGVLFEPGDPDLARIVEWIRRAEGGPGIPVGNPGSHPKDLVLSRDGRHLFVGNTGTQDVSIVDVEAEHEVGAIFVQNVANHVVLYPDPEGDRDLLITLTMGAGFGAPKARDPLGAETWDRDHLAAQFTVLRDPGTTDAWPIEQQAVMGPFDAVDGTWNFKMRDIQNDVVAVDLSLLAIPAWSHRHASWTTCSARIATSPTRAGCVTPPTRPRPPRATSRGTSRPSSSVCMGPFPSGRCWTAIAVRHHGQHLRGRRVEDRSRWPNDPAEKMVPLRAFPVGLRPVGIAAGRPDSPSEGKLFVANQIGETVTIIDRATVPCAGGRGR